MVKGVSASYLVALNAFAFAFEKSRTEKVWQKFEYIPLTCRGFIGVCVYFDRRGNALVSSSNLLTHPYGCAQQSGIFGITRWGRQPLRHGARAISVRSHTKIATFLRSDAQQCTCLGQSGGQIKKGRANARPKSNREVRHITNVTCALYSD